MRTVIGVVLLAVPVKDGVGSSDGDAGGFNVTLGAAASAVNITGETTAPPAPAAAAASGNLAVWNHSPRRDHRTDAMSDRESPTSREADNANVAAVRELYRTWNAAGPVAFCALLHPEVVWHELAELPGAGDHHGRPEVQRHLMPLVDTVGMFRASVEGIEERS